MSCNEEKDLDSTLGFQETVKAREKQGVGSKSKNAPRHLQKKCQGRAGGDVATRKIRSPYYKGTTRESPGHKGQCPRKGGGNKTGNQELVTKKNETRQRRLAGPEVSTKATGTGKLGEIVKRKSAEPACEKTGF